MGRFNPPFCGYTLPHNFAFSIPPFHTQIWTSWLLHFFLNPPPREQNLIPDSLRNYKDCSTTQIDVTCYALPLADDTNLNLNAYMYIGMLFCILSIRNIQPVTLVLNNMPSNIPMHMHFNCTLCVCRVLEEVHRACYVKLIGATVCKTYRFYCLSIL